jgi:hypothetical protein
VQSIIASISPHVRERLFRRGIGDINPPPVLLLGFLESICCGIFVATKTEREVVPAFEMGIMLPELGLVSCRPTAAQKKTDHEYHKYLLHPSILLS